MLLNFFKGMAMGAADMVPGISGGTIAFITGIYTRLIDGIAYFSDFLRPGAYRDFFGKVRGIDWQLFLPLLTGIFTSFVLLSNLLSYLLSEHVALTYAFFFGLIAASSVVLMKHLESIDWKAISFLVLGMIIGSSVAVMESSALGHSFPVLFFSGMIAINAMILPGISGAFILLLLGQYEYIIGVIKGVQLTEIFIFAAGAGSGLLLFARALRYLLHTFRNVTISFLTGLMLGSLLLPGLMVSNAGFTGLPVIASAVGGAILVLALDKVSK